MILVTGATGTVGSQTVRLLAHAQHPVRALVRDPSRAPRGDAEVVTGDFEHPDTLDAAMRGVHTVVLVSPAIPEQEIAVIDSAARAAVAHVVKATSKASADSPVERRRGQARIEAHLQASGLAHTLLRSNAYMQNLLALAPTVKQTSSFVMSAGDGQVGMIDARDAAATAAQIAVAPAQHTGRAYRLTGPALLTYSDIATELSRVLGHPVDYRRISPDRHREAMIGAGIPAAVATSNAKAFELIADGDAAWLSGDVQAVTGAAPRDLRTFITDHLQAFA